MLVRFRKDRVAFEVGGKKFPPTRKGLREALIRYGEHRGGLNEVLEVKDERYTWTWMYEILPHVHFSLELHPEKIGW